MSLYNMTQGANPATFFVLPMLGRHPDDYPRFRDCFMQERKFIIHEGLPVMMIDPNGRSGIICVFMRVGGGNRESYVKEIEDMRKMPTYIRDFDDEFDPTYATFVFDVPTKWRKDFDTLMKDSNIKGLSEEYRRELYKIYPKLKAKFDEFFYPKEEQKKET